MPIEFDRRQFLAAVGAATGLVSAVGVGARRSIAAPGLAITVDDFDLSDTPLLTGEARDRAIRAALKRHHVKAAGFVAGKYVDATLAPRVLQQWSSDGHLIGNHSFSHRYFGGDDPDGFMGDILKCEALLSGYNGFRNSGDTAIPGTLRNSGDTTTQFRGHYAIPGTLYAIPGKFRGHYTNCISAFSHKPPRRWQSAVVRALRPTA